MRYLFCLLISATALLAQGQSFNNTQTIATGHLPVAVTDDTGTVHLVFGQDSIIYYTTASEKTAHVSQPLVVAILPGLVAGAKRGPQLALTDQFIVITAVNRVGDIFAYSLDRKTGRWSPATRINDVPEIAKEGFQAVAGATAGVFHAAWLDLRDDRQNKLVGATSTDGGRTWSANQVIYRSPEGTVCECCRVSMAVSGEDIYVQFRNSLGGSRDMFLVHSADGGKTYTPAQKLGTGTWKLNACPMDGGAVVLTATGQPLTVWRRENTLFTCQPGQPEQAFGTGRNVTLSQSSTASVVAWDEGGTVWIKVNDKAPVSLGAGQIPSLAISGRTVFCVWEAQGQVVLKRVVL